MPLGLLVEYLKLGLDSSRFIAKVRDTYTCSHSGDATTTLMKPKPTHAHDQLWNDLPTEERKRLMPHMIEAQKLHIIQCRAKAVSAHKRHMSDLDNWLKSLDRDLISENREQTH